MYFVLHDIYHSMYLVTAEYMVHILRKYIKYDFEPTCLAQGSALMLTSIIDLLIMHVE